MWRALTCHTRLPSARGPRVQNSWGSPERRLCCLSQETCAKTRWAVFGMAAWCWADLTPLSWHPNLTCSSVLFSPGRMSLLILSFLCICKPPEMSFRMTQNGRTRGHLGVGHGSSDGRLQMQRPWPHLQSRGGRGGEGKPGQRLREEREERRTAGGWCGSTCGLARLTVVKSEVAPWPELLVKVGPSTAGLWWSPSLHPGGMCGRQPVHLALSH